MARKRDAATEGILTARPGAPTEAAVPGLHSLNLSSGARDGFVYIPTTYRPDRAAPLAIMLHGAGGEARRSIETWRDIADGAGLVLLAPDSRAATWDVIRGGYGPDIAYLDAALARVFAACAIDASRLCACGFSDGASYALSVGVGNGDLFTHVVAFSPGFAAPARQEGKPRFYVSHGTQDAVLPIERCSRRLVPQLQRAGYDVTYREFDGPHTVPPEIAAEAQTWFLG